MIGSDKSMVDARLDADRSNPAFLCFVSTSAKAVSCNAENAAAGRVNKG